MWLSILINKSEHKNQRVWKKGEVNLRKILSLNENGDYVWIRG